jgi:hypothetical protein
MSVVRILFGRALFSRGRLTSLARNYRGPGGNFQDGFFASDDWEKNYPPILEDQLNKYGNPGQEIILNEYFYPAAEFYCKENGELFEEEEFISYIREAIGDEKFDAIDLIVEDCAAELVIAWDDSFAGDGFGDKMFRSRRFNEDSYYGSMGAAFANYKANAAARGIKLGDNPFE